jgi:hypothetical protein
MDNPFMTHSATPGAETLKSLRRDNAFLTSNSVPGAETLKNPGIKREAAFLTQNGVPGAETLGGAANRLENLAQNLPGVRTGQMAQPAFSPDPLNRGLEVRTRDSGRGR